MAKANNQKSKAVAVPFTPSRRNRPNADQAAEFTERIQAAHVEYMKAMKAAEELQAARNAIICEASDANMTLWGIGHSVVLPDDESGISAAAVTKIVKRRDSAIAEGLINAEQPELPEAAPKTAKKAAVKKAPKAKKAAAKKAPAKKAPKATKKPASKVATGESAKAKGKAAKTDDRPACMHCGHQNRQQVGEGTDGWMCKNVKACKGRRGTDQSGGVKRPSLADAIKVQDPDPNVDFGGLEELLQIKI